MTTVDKISDETLEELKHTLLEIMTDFDAYCKKHDLSYFLIGGTLLGAVRHQGFIPWDDDLDVVMPRDDYERFIEMFNQENQHKYVVQSIETDENYWLPFAKLRKNLTLYDDLPTRYVQSHRGIFIDIFPLDHAAEPDNKKQGRKVKLAKMLRKIADFKTTALFSKDTGSMGKYLIKSVVAAAFRPFSTHRILTWQKKIITSLGDERSEYYINVGSQYHYKKQTMAKKVYHPATQLDFEGQRFDVPGQYETVLERIFSPSYMELPPEDKRQTHAPAKIIFDTTEVV
jgi:lipopolysaccharide cholinephosphotransferase